MVFVVTLNNAIEIALAVICLIVIAAIGIATAWKRYTCKHDGTYGETSSCHAVCHKCGKDLGFISDWRKRK